MTKVGILAVAQQQNGGTLLYSRAMIEALKLLPRDHYEFTLFTTSDNHEYDDLRLPIVLLPKSLKAVTSWLGRSDLFAAVDKIIAPVYSPYLMATKRPFVFTVHDLQEKYYPENFYLRTRIWRHVNNQLLTARAGRIICESNFVRNDIVNFFKVPPSRIEVVPAPPISILRDSQYNPDSLTAIKMKFNLPETYVFYPAQFWPHKNHLRLVEAFSLVLRKFPNVALVLTGKQRDEYERVFSRVRELGLEASVRHIGYVEQSELASLYRGATVVAIPTLFESISLPIFEAFSIGTSVCASNVVALPEQIGDAGLLFDPLSIEDIAAKICRLLADSKLRSQLVERGFNRIKSVTHMDYANHLTKIINDLGTDRILSASRAYKYSVKPPDPYKFKFPWQRKVVQMLDYLGVKIFKNENSEIDWAKIKKIGILRLDHIGDVLLTTPAIRALKEAYPSIKVDIWVGPWSKEIAEMSGVAENVNIFEAPWMKRPDRKDWSWKALKELSNKLKNENYDLIIDFRGDIRHLFAMRLSKAPLRAGQILTGGKFLLSHPVKYDPGLHIVEQNIRLLNQLGAKISIAHPKPELELERSDIDHFKKHLKTYVPNLEKLIILHPTCEVPSKRWFEPLWSELIDKLPSDYEVILISSGNEKNQLENIRAKAKRTVLIAAGLFTLNQISMLLKISKLFIGVDSGPGHIAAAVGLPVISLFSGIELPLRWKPYGKQVDVIHKETPCSPCDRSTCPFDNNCMAQITVDEVLKKVRQVLKHD